MEAAGKRYITHQSCTERFTITNFSDLHVGAAACAEGALQEDIQKMADDPYAFWIGGGDYADYIGYTDGKRFDPDSVADWYSVADLGDLGRKSVERVRDLLLPIKHKCLGLLLGNHEKAYQRHNQQEGLHGWLCAEMGAPNLGYCALFDLVFIKQAKVGLPKLVEKRGAKAKTSSASFRVFCHHGAGYAQTAGGKLNRLIAFMQRFDADMYFCGHVHDRVARRMAQIGADANCGKLVQRERIGVVSGSYLMTYAQGVTATYGEQRGYEPVPMGSSSIIVVPHTRELHASV